MNDQSIQFNATGIECRLRSYNSEPFRNRTIPHLIGKALLYHITYWGLLEKMAGYDDQLCLTKLNDRGVKEILSTGVTKEMLEKFSRDQLSTDSEENRSVIKFLKDATDQTLSNFNNNQLQQISHLILASPDKLDCIKKILQSPNVNNLLPILARNTSLLNALDSTTLNKIIPLDTPYAQGSDQIASKLFDTIIKSSDHVKETLIKHSKLLEKISPELLYKILTSPSPSSILKTLEKYPDLLNPDPEFLDKMLTSNNLLRTLERAHWTKYITISTEGYSPPNSNLPNVSLNQDRFINNPNMDLWNVLPQKEDPIDNASWDIVQTRLADIFDAVYKERDNERERLFRFLEQCMGTSDARTPAGEQEIRKRVDAIVTVLEQYLEKMNALDLPKEKHETIRKDLIGRTLDFMAMGGSACPDNAIVLLRLAENHIKLFENPKYLPNIIVNMFKLNSITEKLIDADNAENVETYLSYTLKLSDILGLGISGTMIYEEHYGKTEPFEKALPKLSTAFTPEQLINFTTGLEEFRSFYADAKENALKAKQEEFLDALDEFREVQNLSANNPERQKARAKTDRLEQELKDIENSFFANTARQLFLDSGFFTTTPPVK